LIDHAFKLAEEELPSREELRRCLEFQCKHDMRGMEVWFLPEFWFYSDVLELMDRGDIVYDVAAGFFTLSLLLAEKCRKVYAIEVNPTLVAEALKIIGYDLPRNLIVICGNALNLPLPPDITKIVLLHIHWQHPIPKSWRKYPIITSIGGELKILDKGG